MHQIRLSPEILEIAARRRGGKLRLFDRIDPRRTAHLIVDLQNGFMRPSAPVEVPTAREIVPNVNTISRALRVAGGANVFLQYSIPREALDTWSIWYAHFHDADNREMMHDAFRPGSPDWQLWPGLDVANVDLRVEKTRFSPFVPGASNLRELLEQRRIDTLIISGTLTNTCCECTARDAMQLNYKVLFVADATAARSDAAHNATLTNMCNLFADVVTAEDVVALLGRAAGGAPAALS